jgi:predicted amidohydrolase
MASLLRILALAALWSPAAAQTAPKEKAGDRNPGQLRMALVCMKSLATDGPDAAANQKNVQTNLDRHLYFIDRAAAQGAEFVGFPELSLNGYHFSSNMTWLSLAGPQVQALARKAVEKKLYVAAGIAEAAADGRKWNTHFVLGPDGKVVGWHHKIWLTAEMGFTETGTDHNVFEVKGARMGISTCADGSDYANVKALADAGARIIYGPHANTTGSTLAGWYRFRSRWGGTWDGKQVPGRTSNDGPEAPMPSGGWIAQLKVYAALHNHAGLYHPDFNPPVTGDASNRFASGAWFIGPDGQTLAQMPSSTQKDDSKEYILLCNIPTGKP